MKLSLSEGNIRFYWIVFLSNSSFDNLKTLLMNWIIQYTEKLKFHTNLKEILKPILADIKSFNWLISDIEFISDKYLPINHEEDFFILSNENFNEILNSETQIIWGVICGFPKNQKIIIDKNSLPYTEGNDSIWEDGNFQVENAVIEINAFDSTYTIIKFKNEILSEKFKLYFDEALPLNELFC